MFHTILGVAAGYIAGAFTPAIGRRIKALLVKESKTAVAAVENIL